MARSDIVKIINDVYDKLNRLPDDPDTIADFLFNLGIRNCIPNYCNCPIAKYLGGKFKVDYSKFDMCISLKSLYLSLRIKNSSAVIFASRFDSNEYNQLRLQYK